MRNRIIMLVCACAILGCIGFGGSDEQAVVDGLAQHSQFTFMERKENPVVAVWNPQESYIPASSITNDEDIISALSTEIAASFSQYNPGLSYCLDDAYVDSIMESIGCPGGYRIVVIVDTERTMERLVFDVGSEEQAELIRYSQIRVEPCVIFE